MFIPRQRIGYTLEQLERARQLRAMNPPVSWGKIAKEIGKGTADSIHSAIDAEYRENRNYASRHARKALRRRNANKAEDCKSVFAHYIECRSQPSEDALAERAKAFSTERTLTAEFFGDPLPGRSALDKRNDL